MRNKKHVTDINGEINLVDVKHENLSSIRQRRSMCLPSISIQDQCPWIIDQGVHSNIPSASRIVRHEFFIRSWNSTETFKVFKS